MVDAGVTVAAKEVGRELRRARIRRVYIVKIAAVELMLRSERLL